MKKLFIAVLFFSTTALAQKPSCENIFIITTDGFRWEELFSGADSAILFNPQYVKDTSYLPYLYWATTAEERRKKLMPFLWNYVVVKGQLWGNRKYDNQVSVANPYHFSYAGYNELLTGYADPLVVANKPKNNRNSNLLGYLNELPQYKNSVALFGSWKLFSYIANGTNKKIPLNCGYDAMEGDSLSTTEQTVNFLQQNSSNNTLPTRTDLLTFTLATEYITKNHPHVVYMGFGETDEFAHHGQYDNYLNQANQFDKFLAQIWTLIQQDDFYKNKTTIFITTDHGRGRKPSKWTTHGPFIGGSDETWMVQMGPNIAPLGEVKEKADFNTAQFAQTIAGYLGESFTAKHPVADPIISFSSPTGVK
ncbi:MAG: alkaline phosphatase family protein [Sphingobacteriales bacterium]|nr:alkaline phosphatase family protein [Sphingobacteriales bacterium]